MLRNILGSGLSAFWLTLSAELLPIFVSASQNTVRCRLTVKSELFILHAKAAHQANVTNEHCCTPKPCKVLLSRGLQSLYMYAARLYHPFGG